MALKEGFIYEPILPLDKLILDFLPKQGAMFANIYPIGETVKAMAGKIGKGQVRTSIFSARMRLLHKCGLVIPIKALGSTVSGKAWQITPAGEEKLAEWKGASDGDSQQ